MTGHKTWFITGISKGIGTEIAANALSRGDTVIGTVRSQDLPHSLQNQPNLHVLTLDITDEAKTKQIVTKALELAKGKIDVLVNNAANVISGAVEEVTVAQWRQQFDLNVFALVHVTQLILPSMRHNKSGYVINISSAFGRTVGPGWAAYAASKYAVEAITEALAQEVKSFGIHATTVQPGYIRTDILVSGTTYGKNQLNDVYNGIRATEKDILGVSGSQAGDPKRVGKAIVDLANMSAPPVHLPLGSDSYQMITGALQAVVKEIEQYKDIATSTDYPK